MGDGLKEDVSEPDGAPLVVNPPVDKGCQIPAEFKITKKNQSAARFGSTVPKVGRWSTYTARRIADVLMILNSVHTLPPEFRSLTCSIMANVAVTKAHIVTMAELRKSDFGSGWAGNVQRLAVLMVRVGIVSLKGGHRQRSEFCANG